MTISTRTQAERLELQADRGLRDAESPRDLALPETCSEHHHDLMLTSEPRAMTRLGVLVEQMRALPVTVELQVLSPVVMADAVSMVDDLPRSQSSPDVLLHDPAVLHDLTPRAILPDPPADVALASDLTAKEADLMVAWQGVEPSQPTRVGAEPTEPVDLLRSEGDSAVLADFHDVSLPHRHDMKTRQGKLWRPRLISIMRALIRNCQRCEAEWAREYGEDCGHVEPVHGCPECRARRLAVPA